MSEGAKDAGLPEGAKPFTLPEGSTSMEIGREFSAFKVVPKADGESNDANFPHHLHAAVELFCHAGMPENAKRCAKAVSGYLAVLREGPDGKNTNGMGQAAVCWSCGHVGLPKNPEKTSKGENAVCGVCGSDEQTNLIKVTQVSKREAPFTALTCSLHVRAACCPRLSSSRTAYTSSNRLNLSPTPPLSFSSTHTRTHKQTHTTTASPIAHLSIVVTQPDGTIVPWIEFKAPPPVQATGSVE